MSTQSSGLIVVGGGIAGLAAANLAADCGIKVTLLEAAPTVGGLLRSLTLPGGQMVDHGTHILTHTGNTAIDQTLMDVLAADEVCELPGFIPGQFRYGHTQDRKMWLDLGHPDADQRRLLEADLERATEMLEVRGPVAPPANCAEWVERNLGGRILHEVYTPLLQKLQFAPPEQLHPEVIRLFGLQRVCAYTPEETRKRKQAAGYDAVLGYHDCLENARRARVFYPRQGAGAWTEALLQRALAAGVQVRTSAAITSIELRDHRLEALLCLDGTRTAADAVVWTAPAGMFLRSAGLSAGGVPPRMLTSVIVHLVFDRPLRTSAQYVSVFDTAIKAFRLTVYQNLRPMTAQGWSCTVEYLCLPDDTETIDAGLAEAELRKMGVLEEGARLIEQGRQEHRGGFPILTTDFMDSMEKDASTVQAQALNVFLGGKARGQDFFTTDVLKDIHARLPSFLMRYQSVDI
jgi:protoporphyrinogen oxidase